MTREEAIEKLKRWQLEVDDEKDYAEYLEGWFYKDDEIAFDMAIEALKAQATFDDVSTAYENGYRQGKFEALQWIPVSERLPKVGEEILATITDDSYKNPVIIRYYDPELEEKLLVAWMPLPSPYPEEEQ